jgi:hypothetical protein
MEEPAVGLNISDIPVKVTRITNIRRQPTAG